jgi:hypothetical protein
MMQMNYEQQIQQLQEKYDFLESINQQTTQENELLKEKICTHNEHSAELKYEIAKLIEMTQDTQLHSQIKEESEAIKPAPCKHQEKTDEEIEYIQKMNRKRLECVRHDLMQIRSKVILELKAISELKQSSFYQSTYEEQLKSRLQQIEVLYDENETVWRKNFNPASNTFGCISAEILKEWRETLESPNHQQDVKFVQEEKEQDSITEPTSGNKILSC